MNRSLWQQIRELAAAGLSGRAVARRLGVHRRTVSQALQADQPPRRRGVSRSSLVDPHRGWLLAKLEQYPELSAARLFTMVREHGYGGGYSLVKRCVAELRPRLRPAYLTLHFAPGECAQADWGSWGSLAVPGGRRRLSFFVMVLCHSRMLYAEFFLGEALEHWLQAHRNALEFFGGVPERIMVDNCRTAVLRPRQGTAPAELNPAYADFARHYDFQVVPCQVRRPNEKGRVESAVGYLKSAFLAGLQPQPPEVLAPALADWLENTANRRAHSVTGRRPCELFAEAEKPALRPLPAGPYDCASATPAVADSRFRVTVDGNRYSVPCAAASRRVTVLRSAGRITIRDERGGLLADHPRSYGRRQEIADPDHERALVLRMRHHRDQRRLERFLSLGPAAAPYLAGLREKRPDWRSHLDRINALAEIHGRDELARVLADALDCAAFSAEYAHNILAARHHRQAEPGPLHLTRRADLLELDLPAPDLNLYK